MIYTWDARWLLYPERLMSRGLTFALRVGSFGIGMEGGRDVVWRRLVLSLFSSSLLSLNRFSGRAFVCFREFGDVLKVSNAIRKDF